MANWVTLAFAVAAVLPPAVAFFLAYGRYDGAFRDNVVFLHFIGGLILGAALGVVTLLALTLGPFLAIVLIALFYPIVMAAAVNRRKWQGERHAVFNGGALGLGVAVMLAFTLLFRLYPAFSLAALGQGLLVSAGLGGLLLGIGFLVGNAVRLRKPFRASLLATGMVLAPAVFVEELFRERVWLWPVLLAAYGLVVGVLAERRLMHEGVSDEARRQRRRKRRAASD